VSCKYKVTPSRLEAGSTPVETHPRTVGPSGQSVVASGQGDETNYIIKLQLNYSDSLKITSLQQQHIAQNTIVLSAE